MFEIGDEVEVATKLLTWDIVLESKIMTITKVYPFKSIPDNKQCYRYACDNNDYINYAEKRILGKV